MRPGCNFLRHGPYEPCAARRRPMPWSRPKGISMRSPISRRALLASLAATLAMPAPLLAGPPEPPATAKTFIEKIYSAYLGSAQKGANGVQLDNAADIKRYFTPGLASLILDDEAAAQKRGQPPTLDGDAFVG